MTDPLPHLRVSFVNSLMLLCVCVCLCVLLTIVDVCNKIYKILCESGFSFFFSVFLCETV